MSEWYAELPDFIRYTGYAIAVLVTLGVLEVGGVYARRWDRWLNPKGRCVRHRDTEAAWDLTGSLLCDACLQKWKPDTKAFAEQRGDLKPYRGPHE